VSFHAAFIRIARSITFVALLAIDSMSEAYAAAPGCVLADAWRRLERLGARSMRCRIKEE
jgi:hypothetical protein